MCDALTLERIEDGLERGLCYTNQTRASFFYISSMYVSSKRTTKPRLNVVWCEDLP